MSINKKASGAKGYQHQYEPPTLTKDEQERVQHGRDAKLCNAEVDRVARNIVTALANPQTPEIVRQHIKAYVANVAELDVTETPEAILTLYPIACRGISQVPFVPRKQYIEALTGNNKKRAIEMAKEYHEPEPHTPLSEVAAVRLTDILMMMANDHEERAAALIALVVGIGFEYSPHDRKALAREVCHRAYAQVVPYSKHEEAFIDKAIREYSK